MSIKNIIKKISKLSLYDIYLEIRRKKMISYSNKLLIDYICQNGSKKLHIGCGGNIFEGWLNTDLTPYSNIIAFLDASKEFPIKDNMFDYIYSEHTFEHLDFKGQLNYLRESYRILKPGGKIRIATPNFDFLMQLRSKDLCESQKKYINWNVDSYLKNIKLELNDLMDPGVYVINNYFRDWGHLLIHNELSISQLINKFGFYKIYYEKVGNSKYSELNNLERHGQMITDEFNLLETMVIEAEKPSNY